MSRIENSLALPVFHDRVPVRADEKGAFLAQLQLPAAGAAEYHGAGEQEPSVPTRQALQQPGAQQGLPGEFHDLGSRALYRLSYRAVPTVPETGQQPDAVATQSLPAFAASTEGPAGAALAVAATRAGAVAGTALRSGMMTLQEATEMDAPALAATLARERETENLLRKVRLYTCADGVELVLRDDGGTADGSLVPQLIEYCRGQQIPLVRIVLNGHVAWSRYEHHKG